MSGTQMDCFDLRASKIYRASFPKVRMGHFPKKNKVYKIVEFRFMTAFLWEVLLCKCNLKKNSINIWSFLPNVVLCQEYCASHFMCTNYFDPYNNLPRKLFFSPIEWKPEGQGFVLLFIAASRYLGQGLEQSIQQCSLNNR